MTEYWRKEDVLKAMEDNSIQLEIFECERTIIDSKMFCCDLADLEIEYIPSNEELEVELAKEEDCSPTW